MKKIVSTLNELKEVLGDDYIVSINKGAVDVGGVPTNAINNSNQNLKPKDAPSIPSFKDETIFEGNQNQENFLKGIGNKNSKIYFIDEFSKYSGDVKTLLSKIIEAMGTRIQEVYLVDVEDLYSANFDDITLPNIIVTLGETATQILLKSSFTLNKHNLTDFKSSKVIATYSPLEMIVKPELKKPVWEDMKKIISLIK